MWTYAVVPAVQQIVAAEIRVVLVLSSEDPDSRFLEGGVEGNTDSLTYEGRVVWARFTLIMQVLSRPKAIQRL